MKAVEYLTGEVLRAGGVLAWTLGRVEEAILLCRRAVEQDPLNAEAYHNLGYALCHADRFAEAESAYRKSLELAPQRAVTRANLALALLGLGLGEEALAEAMREPDEWARLWAMAMVHFSLGCRVEADAALRELIEKYAGDSAFQIAEVHGMRGEPEKAFEWLGRAYAQRDSGLATVKPSAHLRSLHGDPRWGAFLKKMGLED